MSSNDGRNVLFVTFDELRGDCLSALGHPLVQTPTLDALAADGALFLNHFAQCSPCGPSRGYTIPKIERLIYEPADEADRTDHSKPPAYGLEETRDAFVNAAALTYLGAADDG